MDLWARCCNVLMGSRTSCCLRKASYFHPGTHFHPHWWNEMLFGSRDNYSSSDLFESLWDTLLYTFKLLLLNFVFGSGKRLCFLPTLWLFFHVNFSFNIIDALTTGVFLELVKWFFFLMTVVFKIKGLRDLILSNTVLILKLERKTSCPVVMKSQPVFYHRMN